MTSEKLEIYASRLDTAIMTLAAVLLCIMLGLVTANVFTRYVLHLPLTWSAELARYCMVWSALLGAAVLVRRDGHLNVAVLDGWLGPRNLRNLRLAVAAVSMVLFAVMLISGSLLVIRTAGQVASSLQMLPVSVVYAIMPLTGLLMLINSAISFLMIRESR